MDPECECGNSDLDELYENSNNGEIKCWDCLMGDWDLIDIDDWLQRQSELKQDHKGRGT